MKNRIRPLALGAVVVAVCSLAAAVFWDRAHAPRLSAELSGLWTTGVTSLEKGDPKAAKEAFTRWIERARSQGIESPEARYNLAMAHWALKDEGSAALELLNSLHQGLSLAHLSRAKSVLAAIQRDLGISDSVTREASFRIRMWITANGIAFCFTVGFWFSVLFGLIYWRAPATLSIMELGLAAVVPLCFLSLAAAGGIVRQVSGEYAVLDAGDSPIALYPSPKVDSQEKLLDLPSGALVHASGETQNGFSKVDSPLIAWVSTAQLRRPSL